MLLEYPSFNGAATFQSQRRRGRGPQDAQRKALQWGRDLSVAETTARMKDPCAICSLQWGRDLSVAETCNFLTAHGYRIAGRASMGPRPFSRRDGFISETASYAVRS